MLLRNTWEYALSNCSSRIAFIRDLTTATQRNCTRRDQRRSKRDAASRVDCNWNKHWHHIITPASDVCEIQLSDGMNRIIATNNIAYRLYLLTCLRASIMSEFVFTNKSRASLNSGTEWQVDDRDAQCVRNVLLL